MEYFDVLDAKGNPTGQKKPRNLVHQDGDWHRAVHVWIMNSKGELLLQKRSAQKDSHPGHWDISAAGHVSAGDDSIQGALKEVREELGIDPSLSDIKFLFSYIDQSILNEGTFINNEFDDVYLIKKDLDILSLKLQREEVTAVKWIAVAELKEVIKAKLAGYVPHWEEYEKLIAHLC